MSNQFWSSTVTGVGADSPEMFDAGVYILFGEPVPAALADISIVHSGSQGTANVEAGDTLWIGDVAVTIDEVGHRANQSLAELGHSVVYINVPQQKLLPGAMKATGDQRPVPRVGDRLAFARGR